MIYGVDVDRLKIRRGTVDANSMGHKRPFEVGKRQFLRLQGLTEVIRFEIWIDLYSRFKCDVQKRNLLSD